MQLSLEDVKIDGGFAELMKCCWVSYENPHQMLIDLFCPVIGSGAQARDEANNELTEPMLEMAQSGASKLLAKGRRSRLW